MCWFIAYKNSDLTREVTRNDDDDKIDDSHADTTMALVEIEDTIFGTRIVTTVQGRCL